MGLQAGLLQRETDLRDRVAQNAEPRQVTELTGRPRQNAKKTQTHRKCAKWSNAIRFSFEFSRQLCETAMCRNNTMPCQNTLTTDLSVGNAFFVVLSAAVVYVLALTGSCLVGSGLGVGQEARLDRSDQMPEISGSELA